MSALAAVAFMAYRAFASRRAPSPRRRCGSPARKAKPRARPLGIGGASPLRKMRRRAPPSPSPASRSRAFLRGAKTPSSAAGGQRQEGPRRHPRLQRRPRVAEIPMQVPSATTRPQRGSLDPEREPRRAWVEGDYAIASVRFTGSSGRTTTPTPARRRDLARAQEHADRKATWLMRGSRGGVSGSRRRLARAASFFGSIAMSVPAGPRFHHRGQEGVPAGASILPFGGPGFPDSPNRLTANPIPAATASDGRASASAQACAIAAECTDDERRRSATLPARRRRSVGRGKRKAAFRGHHDSSRCAGAASSTGGGCGPSPESAGNGSCGEWPPRTRTRPPG